MHTPYSGVAVCDDARMRFRVSIAAFVLLGGLTALVAAKWSVLYDLDGQASAAARRYGSAHPGWVSAWRTITHFGDSTPLIVVGFGVVAALVIGGQRLDALLVVAAAVSTQLLALAIRWLVARPRPVDGFTPVDSWAFPSGHTLHSAVAALLLVHLIKRWRWAVAAAATLAAVLVGVSRVMLLAHWPSDVLGGWLLALGSLLLLFTASDAVRRTRPRPEPPPPAPRRS
jgi:undecaprenyl-diphosphatase